MTQTTTSIPGFIKSLPEEKQGDIKKLDQIISKHKGKHKKVMWEGKFWGGSDQKIIGYGEQTYTRSDQKEVIWFVVGLALQKNYISVFVSAVEDGKYLTEQYKGTLGKAKVGKSSVSFSSVDDIDLEVFEEMIKKSFELS